MKQRYWMWKDEEIRLKDTGGIRYEKFRYQHCPFCGRLSKIIDGVITCDGCGHRERRDRQ